MRQPTTRDFLVRKLPIELHNLLEESAAAHHRSKTQEAIVALRNGLTATPQPLKKPKPFRWGKKISNRFVRKAIEEGRE